MHARLSRPRTGHQGKILSVAWSSLDPNVIATGSADQTIRLWDIRRATGACLLTFNQHSAAAGAQSFGARLCLGFAQRRRACLGTGFTLPTA